MHSAAWWEAYFSGSLDEEILFNVGDNAVGVQCRGTERRFVIVVLGGDKTVLGDREPAVVWPALLAICDHMGAADRNRAIAVLQRFAYLASEDRDAALRELQDVHASIGAVDSAFVERTFVDGNGIPRAPVRQIERLLYNVQHATPDDAYATEFDNGTQLMREARAMSGPNPVKTNKLRGAAQCYFEASEQPVSATERSEALVYSGAMLVEAADEMPIQEAMLVLEQAANRLALATSIDPDNLDGKRRAADALHHMGDRLCDDDPLRAARLYEQGALHARELLAASPPDEHAATLDVLIGAEVMLEDCYRRGRRPDDAKQALARAVELTERLASPTMNSACAYAAAGRIDDTFRVLEACAPGNTTPEDLKTNDVFDVLHADPRWDALLSTLASAPDAS